jgi:hypothetical protein
MTRCAPRHGMMLPLRQRLRAAGPALLFILAVGCGSDGSTGPEGPPIDGTWVGSVSQLGVGLTLILAREGKRGIAGGAQFTSPFTGPVQGSVSGRQDGVKVHLAIEIEGAAAAGSVVFDGTFQDDDTLTGTLASGLLGGEWPSTFLREGD